MQNIFISFHLDSTARRRDLARHKKVTTKIKFYLDFLSSFTRIRTSTSSSSSSSLSLSSLTTPPSTLANLSCFVRGAAAIFSVEGNTESNKHNEQWNYQLKNLSSHFDVDSLPLYSILSSPAPFSIRQSSSSSSSDFSSLKLHRLLMMYLIIKNW